MRNISALTLGVVQQVFRDVIARVAPLGETTPYDWRGRRLMALADGEDPQDAVTLAQLTALEARLADTTTDGASQGGLTAGSGKVRRGTFSLRASAAAHRGEWFIASDRNNVTWWSTGAAWIYVTGMMRGTLSPNLKPTDLGTNDVGFLFYSTDFARTYRWSGSAWADAGFEEPRGMIAWSADPFSFSGITGWALADGSTVTASTTTGGTQSVALPNLHQRYVRGVTSSPGGTVGAATTHTHPVDPPNTTSGAPSTTTTSGPSGTTEVQAGTGATVASSGHTHTRSETHDVDIASFNSGTPSGTSGEDALPPSYNELAYVRL